MKTLLLAATLILAPIADNPAQQQEEPTVAVPIKAVRAMLRENAALRERAADAIKERDQAIDALRTCVVGRSA